MSLQSNEDGSQVLKYGRTTWVQPHNMSLDTSLGYPGTHNACCNACCTHGCILSVCHFSSWAWSSVLVLLILRIIVPHVHCTQVQIGMHASVPNTIIVHRVQLKTMRTIKQQLIPAVLQLYSPWPSESGHTSALNYTVHSGGGNKYSYLQSLRFRMGVGTKLQGLSTAVMNTCNSCTINSLRVQIGMHAWRKFYMQRSKTMRTIKQQLIPAVLQSMAIWIGPHERVKLHGAFWWWK